MSLFVSVVICTHNPRSDYLDSVLASLEKQTLSVDSWELLLIDNASEQTLSNKLDLQWHPNARHILEATIGLTPARLRGINESKASLIIFVDDDNVLDDDYLEVALKISEEYPFLGAWGGQIRAEFEVFCPEWVKPYLGFLAIREFDRDAWSNIPEQNRSTPCGAGMCIRKSVAEQYAVSVSNDSSRARLDRKGHQLTSCGDSDMAFIACDAGLGTGQFSKLKLVHLIPASRLTEQYISKLMEGMSYSAVYLSHIRGIGFSLPKRNIFQKSLNVYRLFCLSAPQRRIRIAEERGYQKAVYEIYSNT